MRQRVEKGLQYYEMNISTSKRRASCGSGHWGRLQRGAKGEKREVRQEFGFSVKRGELWEKNAVKARQGVSSGLSHT